MTVTGARASSRARGDAGGAPGAAPGARQDSAPGCRNLAPEPEARQALVLSGGGALGAYEVGVVRALVTGASPVTGYRPLDVFAYSGTSVGAYNGSFLATRSDAGARRAIEELEGVWRERIANTPASCGNGVFRIRGAPFQFLDPGCLLRPLDNAMALLRDAGPLTTTFVGVGEKFVTSDQTIQVRLLQTIDITAFISVAPLDALVADTIDIARIGRTARRLAVVASNWRTGRPMVFDNREIAYRVGRQAILASMALPGFFPPVPIDGTPFVDGAVTMNTPLKPAITAGADVVHVVYADPLIEKVPFSRLPTTLDSFYRLYLILVAQSVNMDLGSAGAINAMLAQGGGAARGGADTRLIRRGRAHLHADGGDRPAGGAPYRPIEVHKYRPHTYSGNAAGLIDFNIEPVDANIAQGFQDTVGHDCDEEGCVLVDRAQWHPPARRAERRAEERRDGQ